MYIWDPLFAVIYTIDDVPIPVHVITNDVPVGWHKSAPLRSDILSLYDVTDDM